MAEPEAACWKLGAWRCTFRFAFVEDVTSVQDRAQVDRPHLLKDFPSLPHQTTIFVVWFLGFRVLPFPPNVRYLDRGSFVGLLKSHTVIVKCLFFSVVLTILFPLSV